MFWLLYGPTLTTVCDHWEDHCLDYTRTFDVKVMSLLFNMLSRFVIAFLPRSNCLLISWLQSTSAEILEPKKTKSVTTTFPPSICHVVMGVDAMILVFLIFSLNLAFSLPFFTLIKRLVPLCFVPLEWYVSSANLRLLMFLPPILIPACNSSSLTFLMMHSVYRLNRLTADSPVILLCQSWTNQLFHTGF